MPDENGAEAGLEQEFEAGTPPLKDETAAPDDEIAAPAVDLEGPLRHADLELLAEEAAAGPRVATIPDGRGGQKPLRINGQLVEIGDGPGQVSEALAHALTTREVETRGLQARLDQLSERLKRYEIGAGAAVEPQASAPTGIPPTALRQAASPGTGPGAASAASVPGPAPAGGVDVPALDTKWLDAEIGRLEALEDDDLAPQIAGLKAQKSQMEMMHRVLSAQVEQGKRILGYVEGVQGERALVERNRQELPQVARALAVDNRAGAAVLEPVAVQARMRQIQAERSGAGHWSREYAYDGEGAAIAYARAVEDLLAAEAARESGLQPPKPNANGGSKPVRRAVGEEFAMGSRRPVAGVGGEVGLASHLATLPTRK